MSYILNLVTKVETWRVAAKKKGAKRQNNHSEPCKFSQMNEKIFIGKKTPAFDSILQSCITNFISSLSELLLNRNAKRQTSLEVWGLPSFKLVKIGRTFNFKYPNEGETAFSKILYKFVGVYSHHESDVQNTAATRHILHILIGSIPNRYVVKNLYELSSRRMTRLIRTSYWMTYVKIYP